MPAAYNYIRDPQEITRRSFELIRAEVDVSALPVPLQALALRVVHASAMPEILTDLRWQDDPATAGQSALAQGAPILADCRMVADGVTRSRLPADNQVLCPLLDPEVPARAQRSGITRSAAAVELWVEHLAGAVVAIGNAPTALFRLLELLAEGAPSPAVVLAFPVGFVGATESKAALVEANLAVPFVTLQGRRGGSAMAAAAVNALARSEP